MIDFQQLKELHSKYADKLNMDHQASYVPIDFNPIKARIEMFMNGHGLGIVVPDFIMPHFEFEPITEADLIGLAHRSYWYKRANIKRFRSIIRKAKQATTI